MAWPKEAALSALSSSKSARAALVEHQDPAERRTHVTDQALVAHRHAFDVGFDLGEVRALAHPRHVDLFVEPRDVLGERALQEAVVLRDEGDLYELQRRRNAACSTADW